MAFDHLLSCVPARGAIATADMQIFPSSQSTSLTSDMSMILRSAPPSPFGRKVKIAASVLGLSDRIEIVAGRYQQRVGRAAHAEPARKNSDAGSRRRTDAVRFARDPGLSRSSRRRRPHHPARAGCALRGAADAGAVRRHPGCIDPAGLRGALPAGSRSVISHGSTIRPARLRARLRRWKPNRRRSTRSRMSDRSRWPAHSAIRICVSPVPGASHTRSWWRGSTVSPRRSPHSNRRGCTA